MTIISHNSKHLKRAVLLAVIVFMIACTTNKPPEVSSSAARTDTNPPVNRQKIIVAMNMAFAAVGNGGTASLDLKDDRILHITAEWMDEANANGWVAGAKPSSLRKYGFHTIHFLKVNSEIVAIYDVVSESWSVPKS